MMPNTKRAHSYFVCEAESCPIITKSYMNISNIMRVLGNLFGFFEKFHEIMLI